MTGTGIQPSKPSEHVIVALADTYEVDPGELTPPINEVVDLEALDTICGTNGRRTSTFNCEIQFRYEGYDVLVNHGETTTVAVQSPGESE